MESKQILIEFYLDFWNNFLTIEKFAEHYGIDEIAANKLVESGKYYFNNK